MINENIYNLRGVIPGPVDTPYQGGKFKLQIRIPETYPLRPPMIKFLTRIWHPNIFGMTGAVCLDILSDKWIPVLTIRTVLQSLQVLLSEPNPNDPLNEDAARQYKNNLPLFEKTVNHWTNVYGKGPIVVQEYNELVESLVNLGAHRNSARFALSCMDWNFEKALQDLTI